ncbi:CU044_2847 family protein [Streptomyces sp. NPDC090994]|uniref:CU044_2847 family protein n=1 Tax=Streptomyces sp. NPDC090994 TaxID=3365969 RepID=UPI003824180B
MGREVTRVARIALPDGTPVWARISGGEELSGRPGGLAYSDTGFTERVEATVESLHSLVTGVARSLAEPLRAVRPDEVSVQFGIELTAKAGKVVGLLADGEAKAGITVTLTWNSGAAVPYPPGDGTEDAGGPGGPGGSGGTGGTGGTGGAGGTSSGTGGGARDGASPGAAGHGGAGSAAAGGGA